MFSAATRTAPTVSPANLVDLKPGTDLGFFLEIEGINFFYLSFLQGLVRMGDASPRKSGIPVERRTLPCLPAGQLVSREFPV